MIINENNEIIRSKYTVKWNKKKRNNSTLEMRDNLFTYCERLIEEI